MSEVKFSGREKTGTGQSKESRERGQRTGIGESNRESSDEWRANPGRAGDRTSQFVFTEVDLNPDLRVVTSLKGH